MQECCEGGLNLSDMARIRREAVRFSLRSR